MLITKEELSTHNSRDDCWVSIDGKVYDVTKFLPQHPGGEKILYDCGGRDCTNEFFELHRLDVLWKYESKLLVGELVGVKSVYNKPLPALSLIPYTEIPAFQGFESPYYTDSHRQFQTAMRNLMGTHFPANKVESMAVAGRDPSKKLWLKLGEAGFHAANVGPGRHIGVYTPALGGVGADTYDYFHEMIQKFEVYRLGSPGLSDALLVGNNVGLPPVIHFKTLDKNLMERVIREVCSGEERICLAVSEPWAGSDVANIRTTAVKSDCGQFYVVNGIKKWITGGMPAKYFTTAVRTGPRKLSFLLIDRDFGGVLTKKIKTKYSGSSGTALVIYEDVKVPISHLIGKQDDGFKMIMHNFNHERWALSLEAVATCRHAISECAKWLMQRTAFKQPLAKQPALRQKMAEMISQTEALQGFVETMTYQMNEMDYKKQNKILGGPICLLKVRAARTVKAVADEAVQIMGGRGLTVTGMGQVVQRLSASNQFTGILGGANEVLGDYAVRQMMKAIPAWSRL